MRFNERVGVWRHTASSDNFGGNTVSETQLGSSWAKVRSVPREKYLEYGLNVDGQAIEIFLRSRDDIDYMAQDIFFKYNGKNWYPSLIEDYSFKDELIRVVANGER